MIIPKLKIGNLAARLPIIQGGMGVGISMHKLAAAVANCGGVGVISAAEPGANRAGYHADKKQANITGLVEEIKQARSLSPQGILGVNIMVALSNFEAMVAAAVEAGIDIIFAGAGLPLTLPALVKGSAVKLGPIVSSAKAAALICRHWDKNHQRMPDVFVLEGPRAGGHLGFSHEQLANIDDYALEKLVPEIVEAVKPFEEKYGQRIPVVAAGGIWDGKDITRMLQLGAAGVQMSSRFVTTYECDASDAFKQEYLRATEEDIMLIQSPVGMPGRAVRNAFLERVTAGETKPIRCSYNCLKPCKPKDAPYCIAEALINARDGVLEHGFAFAGDNAWRADRMCSVKEIMDELEQEMQTAN